MKERICIRIDKSTHRWAKAEAKRQRRTVSGLIEVALDERMAAKEKNGKDK